MKIIDLLNKIANGEEVPKKIKWENIIFAYSEYDKDYLEFPFSEEEYQGLFCMKDSILTQFLDDEVEILDDEDEEKESLYKPYAFFEFEYTDDLHEIIKKSNINFKSISEKVNEIIYYLEKQRKGE